MLASVTVEFNDGPATWPALVAAAATVLSTSVALYLGVTARTEQRREQQLALRRQVLDPVIDWLADADRSLVALDWASGSGQPIAEVDRAAEAARLHTHSYRRLETRTSFVLGDHHPLVAHFEECLRAFNAIIVTSSTKRAHLGLAHPEVVAWHLAYQAASREIAAECGFPEPVVDEDDVRWQIIRDTAAEMNDGATSQ